MGYKCCLHVILICRPEEFFRLLSCPIFSLKHRRPLTCPIQYRAFNFSSGGGNWKSLILFVPKGPKPPSSPRQYFFFSFNLFYYLLDTCSLLHSPVFFFLEVLLTHSLVLSNKLVFFNVVKFRFG